ncbi:hypothetical protein F4778DRAFT_795111 [Xylariomycetidae sp. FL2044]|nr:hypothetical protein F4778DRAFT_795111 [Xylariomycetidae sp. FL2044]
MGITAEILRIHRQLRRALLKAILEYAEHDDDESRDALGLVLEILLKSDSGFTGSPTPEGRIIILGNSFFAARHGCLDTLKLIYSKYPEVDVNHFSFNVRPGCYSALYVAAGTGRKDVVKYLLAEHGEPLDNHLGNGTYANGPTPLWYAVNKGHANVVKMLLAHGGPVSHIGEFVNPGVGEKGKMRLVVTAADAYRRPVRVGSEAEWESGNSHKLDHETDKGMYTNGEGRHVGYVILELDARDREWLHDIQLRKSDKELESMEKRGRKPESPPQDQP